MSLVSFALRLIASRILVNRTWAGGNVLNAPVTPIEEVLRRAQVPHTGALEIAAKPTIGVFSSAMKSKPTGRDIGSDKNSVSMTFFIYAAPISVIGDGAGMINVDAGQAAFVLDLVARQIMNELRAGASPWRPLWEQFAVRYEDHAANYTLLEISSGVRIPALEIDIEVHTIPEPTVGIAPFACWAELLVRMRADADAAPIADLVEAAIKFRDNLADWKVAQHQIALSFKAARAMGFTPQDITDENNPLPLSQIGVTGIMDVGP